ncbi:MAG: RNA polymerase sigma factor, partial [bacterium]
MFGRHSASLLQIAQDRKLVRKLLTGDEKAFRAFVDEYFPKIYRYAKCQLQNNEDVEEVVQSALSNAAKNLDKYRGEATLLTWLIQICRNEINHTYRRMAKQDVAKPYLNDDVLRSVIESLAAPVEENPDARFARNELISFIQFALDQLP